MKVFKISSLPSYLKSRGSLLTARVLDSGPGLFFGELFDTGSVFTTESSKSSADNPTCAMALAVASAVEPEPRPRTFGVEGTSSFFYKNYHI